jgi:carboxyl-terminal processing protease
MRRRAITIGVGLVILSTVVFLHLLLARARTRQEILSPEQRQLNVESFETAWTTIRDTYWDPDLEGIDWQALHDELLPEVERAETMPAARAIMEEMVGRLGRSHFHIIPAEAFAEPPEEDDRRGRTGMTVRVIAGDALVTSVDPGSPAESEGVRPGWIIDRVDGIPVLELLDPVAERFEGTTWLESELVYAVVRRLNGPQTEKVPVRFVDGTGQEVDLEIGRSDPPGRLVNTMAGMSTYARFDSGRIGDGRVGYIVFDSFVDPVGTMTRFNEAMESFSDADGVVIDLRGNGGGLGAMVIWMAGWFVEENFQSLGTIFARDYELKLVVQKRARNYSGPLAILVDGLSGSASELFSGGLKSVGRARIVGSRSAGASGPAQITPLPNLDRLMHSTARDVNALGEPIEGVGVIPDIEVLPTRAALLNGRDLPLEAAVRWILETEVDES